MTPADKNDLIQETVKSLNQLLHETVKGLLARIHLLNLARIVHYQFSRVTSSCRYITSIGIHASNVRLMRRGAPDGYSLPSPRMVHLVTGQYRLDFYLDNGALGAECIQGVLARNGLQIHAFDSILDFGCGCGRAMRHLSKLRGPRLYGTDYNPHLIDWCRKAYPFAEFSVNRMHTFLDYEDGQFDFIYAISVFTHLTEISQHLWISELRRVLKPGGYLYLTVHGESYLPRLTVKQKETFRSGQGVVIGERFNGRNVCAAFHPEAYVRLVLAKDFHVADFVPMGAEDAKQDVFLLRKPMALLEAVPV